MTMCHMFNVFKFHTCIDVNNKIEKKNKEEGGKNGRKKVNGLIIMKKVFAYLNYQRNT